GGSFAPLLAFASTWNNESSPAVFNPVAVIANALGVQQAGASATPAAQSAAVRLRNAGTFQYCRDPATGGTMIYDASCTQTEKGYISYSSAHGAFDVYTTSPTGSAVTTGGTLSGSWIVGMVNGSALHMHLVRDGANAGMRILAAQQS